jgi:hypothetical protein
MKIYIHKYILQKNLPKKSKRTWKNLVTILDWKSTAGKKSGRIYCAVESQRNWHCLK